MKSFAFKITCRFAALVTVTTAAVLITAGFVLDHEIESGLEVLHDIEVKELTELIGMDGRLSTDEISDRIRHDADSDAALFAIQVADSSGNVLFRSDNLGGTILPNDTEGDRHRTTRLPFLGRVHVSAYRIGPWQIQIGSPLGPAERVLGDYTRLALPLLVLVGFVSLALGHAFSRATLRRIRAIEATARRITADNLTERIPHPGGRDELASLTQLLNQTFDRLHASFEQVRRFSADVSHELKTPLALIRLNVEKVKAQLPENPDLSDCLGEVLEEVTRLHGIIDRLLFLAKAESGAFRLRRAKVDMKSFVQQFADDAQILSEDRGVHFEVARNDAGEVQVDVELMRQLLLNLVTNSVSACPVGGRIILESVDKGETWLLRVLDDGPGVPETQLTRIFERFARVSDADRSGHGLGLAICRSIATLHSGRISAENRRGSPGLVISVLIPKRRGDPASQ